MGGHGIHGGAVHGEDRFHHGRRAVRGRMQKAVYAVSEKLYKNQAGQANPADNTTPPAGDANGADGQVYDADFKDVDSDKKDGENK